ncbi:hypothetical protein BH09BAC1_BH09BAC1_03260 [soil metagenome]
MGRYYISGLLMALAILSCTTASAQIMSCGTKPSQWMIDYDTHNPASIGRLASLPKANKVFSVFAYICLNEDEQPVTTPADIQTQIDKANVAFAPIGFSFKVCQTITVPDYRYRVIDEGTKLPELVDLYYKPEVINMYFTDTAQGDQGGPLDGFGFMPGAFDAIVLGSQAMKASSFSITHQLGHFFGLYHTFETIFTPELANGSNCQTAGDLVCDTEADPRGTVGSNCIHQGPVADIQGNRYAPPYDNYMQFQECGCRFTVQQYQRMYTIYTVGRNYLK